MAPSSLPDAMLEVAAMTTGVHLISQLEFFRCQLVDPLASLFKVYECWICHCCKVEVIY